MMSEKMQKVIDALQQSFSKAKEEEKPLSLADKLKKKVAEIKNEKGQGQDKAVVFDQQS